jgi:hypothetical protein
MEPVVDGAWDGVCAWLFVCAGAAGVTSKIEMMLVAAARKRSRLARATVPPENL